MQRALPNNSGLLVLISSPSGGGKNSVIRELLKHVPHSAQFVTTTTRVKRAGEIDEKDYYFISHEAFQKKIDAGEFVEWNTYSENRYGTEWQHLIDFVSMYRVVFSQADVHGKKHLDDCAVPHLSIFLVPEHTDILRKRIIARGGVAKEDMDERLRIAEQEIAAANRYDYCIVNKEGQMQRTVETIETIIGQHLPH